MANSVSVKSQTFPTMKTVTLKSVPYFASTIVFPRRPPKLSPVCSFQKTSAYDGIPTLGSSLFPTTTVPVKSKTSESQSTHNEAMEEATMQGGVVVLGKFDALHIGHREIAIQASKVGVPYLLSLAGMAEVLGWEPQPPIVADCDRKRVLSSWAPYCGGVTPTECFIEFSSVRHLSPRQFVEKLSKELGVHGVVAGENYRFGYEAAGDASELIKLCQEYGMEACIVGSVMDKSTSISSPLDSKDKGQVSSTRVRRALEEGDLRYASELLGRIHRLVLKLSEQEGCTTEGNRFSAPKSCFLNLPPKEGLYEGCSCFIGNTCVLPCSTEIDATHIHITSNHQIPLQEHQLVGVEFCSLE